MNTNKRQKGFTLVEMIVSLAIFTVVALVAVGALVKIMDANRKSLTLKTSINNLNFALESMAREMRMGRTYYCRQGTQNININGFSRQDCAITSGDWTIAFRSSKESSDNTCNLIYAYRFTNNTIEKAESSTCTGTINNGNTGSSDFLPLISSDITITRANISVDNTNQPKVFLYIDGSSGIREKDKTAFSIQTTISQRLPK